jgi:lipopolysaccharide heptosyltransferase II
MMDRLLYWLALGAVTVIRRLPLAVCFVLGQIIGAFLWAILPRYRKLARENLSAVFAKEKSAAEIQRLTFRHFTTLGANGICSFKFAVLPQETILRIAPFINSEVVERNILAGRGVVLAISHMGSWELYAQAAFQRPETRFGTIYQALRNPHLDELINRDRRKGVETFDRKKGFQAAIALLRKPGSTAVLVDQSAGHGGIWMPFFNRLCSTSSLAATLAIRTNSAVVPAAIFTSGFARWRIVYYEEIPYDRNNPEQLTSDINAVLERQIRQSPPDWFWVHNRWKTPWPHLLTARQKRGIYLPPGIDPAKLHPFRFVIRSPNWLGDAVMSLRAARAFKLGRPDARLAILTPAKLAAFWNSVTEVDEIISFAPGESVFSIASKLRGRFEAAILFPNSFRSAAEAWLARIPRRVGFRGHFRSMLLTQIIDEPKKKAAARPKHHAERYWHIARSCGAAEPPPAGNGQSLQTDLVVGVCPGAEYGPAKRWPVERFRKTMELVSKEIACSWVILGMENDRSLAAEILQGFNGNVEDLTGKTSLEELIERLRSMRVLLTNDTGTMHLADCLGIPLVAVFGSTEPRLTGPRSPTSTVLRRQVECSPCFLRECPLDFRCMHAVAPEEAAQAILALMGPR